MSGEVLEIDGGVMEGGGQILRMSLAFSALLKKPIKIFNIRAGRSKPGLRSVMLLFQVSFPCLLFADKASELHLRGGTNADMAPQIDHTLMVFKPVAELLGAKFSCKILKRGYFPKGGGEVIINVDPVPSHLQCIQILNPGTVMDIRGRSFAAGNLPIKVAHSIADAASRCLRGTFPSIPMEIERVKEPFHLAKEMGSGIVITAKTDTGCLIGGSALGRRGTRAEEVGEFAGREILEVVRNKACVDSYIQDQLIIFLALAKGKSNVCIGTPTLHTKTAIFVAEMMTNAKFTVSEAESCILECEGIALQRCSLESS